jgi:hypothetical protein
LIGYPTVFDLSDAQEVVNTWTGWQALLDAARGAVETNLVALMEVVRKILPGQTDEFYAKAEEEIREEIEGNQEARESGQELLRGAAKDLLPPGFGPDEGDGGNGPDEAESTAETDEEVPVGAASGENDD